MKKALLHFPKKNAPMYTGSRLGRNQHFRTIAYKTDGKDDEDDPTTKDGMLAILGKMKTGIETSLTEKAKSEISTQLTEQLKTVNEQIEAIKKLAENADELKAMKDQLEANATEYKALVKAFDMLQTRVKGAAQRVEPEFKSFDVRIKEAIEENTDQIVKFNRKEIKKLTIDIKAAADTSTANITGGSVWGAQYKPGIIANPNTLTQVRDLLKVSAAGPGTDFYFMRENGAGEGAPAPTSEKQVAAATTQATGLKPKFDIDLIESSVKFETIAGYMQVSKKAMLNIPNFVTFLQGRLPQKLMDVESAQLLYGDGTSPNLKGILTAGNFAASTSVATVLVEKIIDDLALLEDTYKRMATGITLRPADYFSFFKNKAAGSGEYDLPQGVTFINGVLYILGVPVAKTTTLTSGDYVVGDFQMGAELLIQDGMTLQFFEQDGDNVKTNQITARIEETIAAPVYGSDYFIKGAVPA